VKSLLT